MSPRRKRNAGSGPGGFGEATISTWKPTAPASRWQPPPGGWHAAELLDDLERVRRRRGKARL